MTEYLIVANNQTTGKCRIVRRGLTRNNYREAQRSAFKNRTSGEIINSYSMNDFLYCYTPKQAKRLLAAKGLNYNA